MAFALNCSLAGVLGLIHGVFGLIVAVAVLLGPFVLGGLGGGDVKMMGVIGVLLGPVLTLHAITIGFVLGGIITLIHLAYLGRTGEVVGRTARMITASIRKRSLAPLRVDSSDPDAVWFPYTLPLGLGSIVAVVLSTGVLS